VHLQLFLKAAAVAARRAGRGRLIGGGLAPAYLVSRSQLVQAALFDSKPVADAVGLKFPLLDQPIASERETPNSAAASRGDRSLELLMLQ
jgi:hypothetical protein